MKTVHAWLARYQREGIEGIQPVAPANHVSHQMPELIEVKVLVLYQFHHASLADGRVGTWRFDGWTI